MLCTALCQTSTTYLSSILILRQAGNFTLLNAKYITPYNSPICAGVFHLGASTHIFPGTAYIPILWKFRHFLSTVWKFEICLFLKSFNVQSRSSLNTQRTRVKTSWMIPNAVLKMNFLFPQVWGSPFLAAGPMNRAPSFFHFPISQSVIKHHRHQAWFKSPLLLLLNMHVCVRYRVFFLFSFLFQFISLTQEFSGEYNGFRLERAAANFLILFE